MSSYLDFITQALNVNIIRKFQINSFKKSSIQLPDWLIVLALEGFLGLFAISIWALTDVKISLTENLWGLWGCLLAMLCVLFVKSNLSLFLDNLTKYAPEIFGDKQSFFTKWLETNFSIRRQIVVSLIFALVFLPLTFFFFEIAIGFEAILYVVIILLFNLILIGNGFYWIIVLPGATKVILDHSKRLNSFDPKNIVWIDKVSDIYQRAALYTSIVGVLVLFPVIASPGNTVTIRAISISWLVIVLLLVIFPYYRAQSNLTNVIRNEQLHTMTTIQPIIYNLLLNGKNSEDIHRAEQLLLYYSKIQSSEKSARGSSLNFRFVNSLLLPFASFLLLNFTNIVEAIQRFVLFFH